MEKPLVTLENGVACSSWNHSGLRLATGSVDGSLSIFDSRDPSSSSFSCTSKAKVHNDSGIAKIIWVPPEYGDAVACVCSDGTLSVWEEVVEDAQPLQWKLCKSFKNDWAQLLDTQFGVSPSGLKMVTAYSNGHAKVYELLDPLELKNWQLQLNNDRSSHVLAAPYIMHMPTEKANLHNAERFMNDFLGQAEFQNVIDSVSTFGKAVCLSASISWNPQRGEGKGSSFVLGFNSDTPQLNSSKSALFFCTKTAVAYLRHFLMQIKFSSACKAVWAARAMVTKYKLSLIFRKVWEFDQAHQRWLPVAELASPDHKGDQVYAVAWAPNIGRPYEVIAVSTHMGIEIWHLGLIPNSDGRLSLKKVAQLSGHKGEVWQMEWDMSGMTLATTGNDGEVRLWQSNLNSVWKEEARFVPSS